MSATGVSSPYYSQNESLDGMGEDPAPHQPAYEADSDDEEAWDEVDVTADNSAAALAASTATGKEFSIVVSKADKNKKK